MTPVLTVRELRFSYDGKRKILDGVNLDLHAGELLAVMGYSGSGKTTLLKIIAGLLYPYEGLVEVKAGKGGVGYIPQNVGLVKNLTALQNVLLGSLGRVGTVAGLLSRFPDDEVEKAFKLLNELGLGEHADRKAGLLSGGERQRVAVARSLMQSPTILLADEFVSDLDVVNAHEVMSMTAEVCRRKNIALMMTMHDTYLVNQFADHVAVLNEGKIKAYVQAHEIDVHSLSIILSGGTLR